jgi:zinc transporter 1/2/3
MVSATDLKVIFIFVFLLAGSLAGFVLFANKSLQSKEKFLRFANCFAGGIFIFVGIVHMLPETQEGFEEGTDSSAPIGYIVALSGYCMILLIEKVLIRGHDHFHSDSRVAGLENPSMKKPLTQDEATSDETLSDDELVAKKRKGIMLTTALVIHSLLEGIATGVVSSQTDVLLIGIAILVHKMPAAFSLGIKLVDLNNPWRISLMTTFVLSSPLGIAIGIGLSSLRFPVLQATFMGLSSGTFIYLGFTEVIPDQFHDKHLAWLKFLGVLSGFLPLAIVSCFISS